MDLVKLISVNKIFETKEVKFQALKDINLVINKGEFLAIIGPSGSGKSTLMNILGLLDRPTSGQYLLEGQDVSKLSPDKLAKLRNQKLGFVFQNFNLLPRTKSIDNVALPLIYSGKSAGERRRMAKKVLEQIGLGQNLNSKPSQLSGGMQQRVAIARSLVTNPEIIFADEPTGNLDTKTGQKILAIFKELNKAGKTIILITHDISISKSAKRIIQIKDGQIIK